MIEKMHITNSDQHCTEVLSQFLICFIIALSYLVPWAEHRSHLRWVSLSSWIVTLLENKVTVDKSISPRTVDVGAPVELGHVKIIGLFFMAWDSSTRLKISNSGFTS